MSNYKEFEHHIAKAVEKFNNWNPKEPVRIISHLDSDGISAASIIINVLNHQKRTYSLSIVQQLTRNIIEQLAKEDYKYFILTDLGSSQLDYINEKLSNKETIILDHHQLSAAEPKESITEVNPHRFGINGSKEISGAGVVYLFSKTIDLKYEALAYLAIVGAIGDVQENSGFGKLNKEILDTAVANEKIDVRKGLKIFGYNSRPLYKALEYCTELFIPSVTGSASGSLKFLRQVKINPKIGDSWKSAVALTKEETDRLTEGIIKKREEKDLPEDIFGNIYTLRDEKENSPIKDLREFSTILNACGRLGRHSLGISVCLGNRKAKEEAVKCLNDYKIKIMDAMDWYNKNKNSKNIIKGNGFLIINAEDKIFHTIGGTLLSILSRLNEVEENTFMLSMTRLIKARTKISLRIAGSNPRKDIDLKSIIGEIASKVKDSESGGHKYAAGAIINTEDEQKFIETAKQVLGKKAIEESIC